MINTLTVNVRRVRKKLRKLSALKMQLSQKRGYGYVSSTEWGEGA